MKFIWKIINVTIKLIGLSAGIKRYASNTAWLVLEKILRLGVGVFVGIWVARYLGPEEFGLLTYAQSFVFLFSAIASLGLDSIVVRELVKKKIPEHVLISTALVLKIIGSLLSVILIAVTAYFMLYDSYIMAIIMVSTLPLLLQVLNVIDFYYQAKVLSKYIVWSNFAGLFCSSVLKIYLIMTQADLFFFALAAGVDALIVALGYLFFFRLIKGDFIFTFDFGVGKKLLLDSWPMLFSGVIVSLYMRIDQLMIQNFLGLEAVGVFAAAVRLSEAWYFIPTIITTSLFPAIVNAKTRSEALYLRRMQNLYSLLIWLAVLLAIPVTLFSENIVFVLYGVDYAGASDVLVVHIWASIFVFLAVSSGKYLASENLTRKILYRNMCGALINIGLNLIFIPRWGVQGAALSTLLAWAFSGYLYDWFDNNLRFMFWNKTRAFLFLGPKDRCA